LDSIDVKYWRQWHGDNFMVSVYASAIYVALIFGIKFFMRNREPFKIRTLLTLWNFGLAIFSIFSLALMLPEYTNLVMNKGLHSSVCIRENKNMVYGVGLLIMAWSKLFELGDTLFIVLRKQKLIFLHWYHHITVLMYTWAVYQHNDPSLPLFMVINVFIHSLMYSYYSMKAMRFRVPTSISMVITSLQLLQMVVGVTVNVYSYFNKLGGGDCDRTDKEINQALIMYGSYLILFGNFFYQTYMTEKPKPKPKQL